MNRNARKNSCQSDIRRPLSSTSRPVPPVGPKIISFMLSPLTDSQVGTADAILCAWWVILPSIGIGWLQQMIASQRISLDFSLRRLESIELNRATLLYERVCNNLKEIERLGANCKGSLRSRYRHRTKIRRQYSKELDDLRAYAHHLRAIILRIRGRPLQRFRSWAHTR